MEESYVDLFGDFESDGDMEVDIGAASSHAEIHDMESDDNDAADSMTLAELHDEDPELVHVLDYDFERHDLEVELDAMQVDSMDVELDDEDVMDVEEEHAEFDEQHASSEDDASQDEVDAFDVEKETIHIFGDGAEECKDDISGPLHVRRRLRGKQAVKRRLRGKQPKPSVYEPSDAARRLPTARPKECRPGQGRSRVCIAEETFPKRVRPSRKRPSAKQASSAAAAVPGRRMRMSQQCPGNGDRPCTYSSANLDEPALIQSSRGQTHCCFCGDEQLKKILAQQKGMQLTKTLGSIKKMSDGKYQDCLNNLRNRRGHDFTEDFHSRVVAALKKSNFKKSNPKKSVAEQWAAPLDSRVRGRGALRKKEQIEYDRVLLRDRAMVRRKFFCPEDMYHHYTEQNEVEEVAKMPMQPGDVASNDTGLPAASCTDRAQFAEWWCKHGSWRICDKCHSVRPRPCTSYSLVLYHVPQISSHSIIYSNLCHSILIAYIS
eukprot:2582834-Amphidinium_carterae.5